MMSHACSFCGKNIETAGAGFCPFCGRAIAQEKTEAGKPVLPAEAEALLKKAEGITNLYERKKVLLQARALCPDEPEIEWALLAIGEVPENSRIPDFSIIRCYLLHMYLEPQEVGKKNFAKKRQELQHGEQLERCLRLSEDPSAFLIKYLDRLTEDYIRIFLLESTRYVKSFLSIRFTSHLDRQLAAPVNKMLKAIAADTELESEFRGLLLNSLRTSFKRVLGNDEYLEGAV